MNFNPLEVFKLPTKTIFAIFVGTGMILFFPNEIIKKLYLTGLREKYGLWLGLIFIISLALLIVEVIRFILTIVGTKMIRHKRNSILKSLDTYKKAIVYLLYVQPNNTYDLPLNDGAVRYLEQYEIIGKSASQIITSHIEDIQWPYLLQPWVVEKLNKNKELASSCKEAFIKCNGEDVNQLKNHLPYNDLRIRY